MYDLNVKWKPLKSKENLDIVKTASKLGWKTIAWNTSCLSKAVGKSQKQLSNIRMEPIDARECSAVRGLTQLQHPVQVEQLSRITVMVDEVVDAQSLTAGNESLKEFDIVAASPGNATVFAYLCKTAEVDIISIDFSRRVPFPMIKKQVSLY
jgi:RNase P/RNase MRP subunit p30